MRPAEAGAALRALDARIPAARVRARAAARLLVRVHGAHAAGAKHVPAREHGRLLAARFVASNTPASASVTSASAVVRAAVLGEADGYYLKWSSFNGYPFDQS